jgi:hypothetical protein
MSNLDLFIADRPWTLPKDATLKITYEGKAKSLSPEFVAHFPQMARLIHSAEVTELTANGTHRRLYTWVHRSGKKWGWLTDLDSTLNSHSGRAPEATHALATDILPEHSLLVDAIGGIQEYFNDPSADGRDHKDEDSMFTWAKNFTFSLPWCFKMESQAEVYDEQMWVHEPVAKNLQVVIDDLLCFSQEANGNLTLYHRKTGQIYMLLVDHAFDYVELLPGHPHCFYTIKGVNTFTDYVETLAEQWWQRCLVQGVPAV